MGKFVLAAILCSCVLPAQEAGYLGTWRNDQVKIELKKARGSRYEGLLSFGGRAYPVTARAEKKALRGTFQDGKGAFPFTAVIEHGKLRLNTGGTAYLLDRDDPVNPLGAPPAPSQAAQDDAGLHRHPSGVAFRVPPGWKVTDTPAAAALVPPGGGAEEIYIIASHEGFAGAGDPELLRRLRQDLAASGLPFDRAGERETFAASGRTVTALTWELRNPETGVPMLIRFFLAESAGRVQSLAAVAARDRVLGWDPQLREVAGSMIFAPSAMAAPQGPGVAAEHASTLSDGTPRAGHWVQRLAGTTLTQVGAGPGIGSRKVLLLGPDGAFTYSGNALLSAAVNPSEGTAAPQSLASRQQLSGRWRVVTRGAHSILELTIDDGTIHLLVLTTQGDAVFLDGVRAWVTDPG